MRPLYPHIVLSSPKLSYLGVCSPYSLILFVQRRMFNKLDKISTGRRHLVARLASGKKPLA